jgi:heterodisulfide reductase subunit A-like polyferredoxin
MEVTHGNQSVVVQLQTDVNTLQFAVESDLDVKYTVPSPQLCDQGKLIFEEARKTAKPDSYLLNNACAPKAQEKVFKKLIRETGFHDKHFVPVDIRGIDNKRDRGSFGQRR